MVAVGKEEGGRVHFWTVGSNSKSPNVQKFGKRAAQELNNVKDFHRTCFTNFLPIPESSFPFLSDTVRSTKVFIFDVRFVFSFVIVLLVSYLRNYCLIQAHRFTSVFSSVL